MPQPISAAEADLRVLVAIIAGASGLMGALFGTLGSYLVSKRQVSRSGVRAAQDLDILDKATKLGLAPEVIAAMKAKVTKTVNWHAHSTPRSER
jgi:hypothetical protein